MITLNNVSVNNDGLKNIFIKEKAIESISFADENISLKDCANLYFKDAQAFPGLINSHDHLEFNLYPKLGNYTYKSYVEWGPDIHKQNKEVIKSVLQIPKYLRVQWGVYKNLLNGITTVIHHGNMLQINNPLIDVFQDCYSLHSVKLEKYFKLKLNKPFAANKPFVIHIGEGTNEMAKEEIDELIRWNFLKRKIIGVHAVAMNSQQAKHFKALVWCPDSNFFLLNATAEMNQLKHVTPILFGTDSTLSSDWSVWNHLRLARKTGLLNDDELFYSITTTPASIWGLRRVGAIIEKYKADIVVARKNNKSGNYLDTFFETTTEDILLVIKSGSIILFDETLYGQLHDQMQMTNFSKIKVANTVKYVFGDIASLINKIKSFSSMVQFPVELA